MARAPPDLPTTHEDPDLSRTFFLGGAGGEAAAQSRAHLTHTRKAHALRPAHLCSAPWSWPATREGIWEHGTVSEAPPHPLHFPGRSGPEPAAAPNRSTSSAILPSPRLPRHRYPQPPARSR